jgi:hypothetical protein
LLATHFDVSWIKLVELLEYFDGEFQMVSYFKNKD